MYKPHKWKQSRPMSSWMECLERSGPDPRPDRIQERKYTAHAWWGRSRGTGLYLLAWVWGGGRGFRLGTACSFLKLWTNKSFQILDCFHENPWFTYNSWHGNSWDRWMGSGNINWIQPSLPSTLSHSPCPFHLLRISGTSPCICPYYSIATTLSVQFQLILFLPVLLS